MVSNPGENVGRREPRTRSERPDLFGAGSFGHMTPGIVRHSSHVGCNAGGAVLINMCKINILCVLNTGKFRM